MGKVNSVECDYSLIPREWAKAVGKLVSDEMGIEIAGNGRYRECGVWVVNGIPRVLWGYLRTGDKVIIVHNLMADDTGYWARCGWKKVTELENTALSGTRVVTKEGSGVVGVGVWKDNTVTGHWEYPLLREKTKRYEWYTEMKKLRNVILLELRKTFDNG